MSGLATAFVRDPPRTAWLRSNRCASPTALEPRSVRADPDGGHSCDESRRYRWDSKAARRARHGRTSSRLTVSVLCHAYFRANAATIQLLHQQSNATEFQVAPEDLSYRLRFRLVHDEATLTHLVAERDRPPLHMPFCLEAAILSRIRAPVTSRSNSLAHHNAFVLLACPPPARQFRGRVRH
jgi:hypothetical protein